MFTPEPPPLDKKSKWKSTSKKWGNSEKSRQKKTSTGTRREVRSLGPKRWVSFCPHLISMRRGPRSPHFKFLAQSFNFEGPYLSWSILFIYSGERFGGHEAVPIGGFPKAGGVCWPISLSGLFLIFVWNKITARSVFVYIYPSCRVQTGICNLKVSNSGQKEFL